MGIVRSRRKRKHGIELDIRYSLILMYVVMVLSIVIKGVILHNETGVWVRLDNILSMLGIGMVLISIISFLGYKSQVIIFTLMNIGISLLLIIDTMYYNYFKDYISLFNIKSIKYVFDVSKSVTAVLHYNLLYYVVVDIISYTLLYILYKIIKRSKQRLDFTKITVPFAVMFILGVIFNYYNIRDLNKQDKFVLTQLYNKSYVVNNTNIYIYHFYDLKKFMNYNNTADVLAKADVDELSHEYKYDIPKDELYGRYSGKNVLLLQLGSFQGFIIGKTINGVEITPNINKLVANNYLVDNLYIQTSVGGTSDAEFLVNTGLLPSTDIPVYYTYKLYEYALPSKLKALGYNTYVMHANDKGLWNRALVYKKMNIDKFYNKEDYKIDDEILLGLSDESFFRQSIEYIKQMPKPFYNMMITLSTHHPFKDIKFKDELNVGQYEGTLLGDYFKAMHYLDKQVGMFIEELDKAGILQDTIVVMYGDHHGIPIEHKNELSKFLGKDIRYDYDWYDNFKGFGLIMVPNHEIQGKAEGIYGQADLYATILHLLGIDLKTMVTSRSVFTYKNDVYLNNGIYKKGSKVYLISTGKYKDIDTSEIRSIDKDLFNNISNVYRHNNIALKVFVNQ